MATTDEKAPGDGAAGRPPSRPPGWGRALRRYGPVVAVVALVAGAVVAFGGGDGDGGDDGEDAAGDGIPSTEELIRSGPMTPQRAELEGIDLDEIDWGPTCDTERMQLALPMRLVPPCVERFEGDNGGATAPGVTEDEVKVVYYSTDPALDPLGAATIGEIGADVDPESAQQTVDAYVDLYNRYFETYGRRVVVERFVGSGASDDVEAARADAIAIAEMEPFAVIGGPAQASSVFAAELASRGIVCGPGCATAIPEHIVEDNAPYLWQALQTPDQGVVAASRAIGLYAGPGKAELAGDPEMRERDRVYAIVHYDNASGDHRPVFEKFVDELAEYGIEAAIDVEFTLDLSRAQENARTNISRLKEAGVTTVIYYGDPITPSSLTAEATAQDYWPEWILGPSLLMDTTIFGRLTDGQQWRNGFGVSTNPARTEWEQMDSFRIYRWAYGEPPPNNNARVIEPPIRTMFTAIHMAGPDLTPETFRDGMWRTPPAGGGPTTPHVSRGDHGIWPGVDWGGNDDGTLIWWDPEAVGEDEVGNMGVGMYRYANGGERFLPSDRPRSLEDAGLFDVESSVTVFDEVPEEDRTPDYPPPEI